MDPELPGADFAATFDAERPVGPAIGFIPRPDVIRTNDSGLREPLFSPFRLGFKGPTERICWRSWSHAFLQRIRPVYLQRRVSPCSVCGVGINRVEKCKVSVALPFRIARRRAPRGQVAGCLQTSTFGFRASSWPLRSPLTARPLSQFAGMRRPRLNTVTL